MTHFEKAAACRRNPKSGPLPDRSKDDTQN
jgi:hypothetical protein